MNLGFCLQDIEESLVPITTARFFPLETSVMMIFSILDHLWLGSPWAHSITKYFTSYRSQSKTTSLSWSTDHYHG